MHESLDFLRVSFTYDALVTPLVTDLTVRFPLGWTGIVGANGSGKTTVLRLALGDLQPHTGQIQRPRSALYCPQRTDDPPAHFSDFLDDVESPAAVLRGRLAVQPDWLARWHTLSHGERKRAQIAVALWQSPDVLAIDEPSNHIDAAARALLQRELHHFRGIGLLVSHDRALLDDLCAQCLFLDPPTAVLRPGGYTKGHAQERADLERLRTQRAHAQREVRRLTSETIQRRDVAAQEHRIRSKRGLHKHDSDGRAKIDLARVTDSKAGAPLRQLVGRTNQAAQRLASLHVKKETHLGIWLPESRGRMDWLFRIPAGAIPLSNQSTALSDGCHTAPPSEARCVRTPMHHRDAGHNGIPKVRNAVTNPHQPIAMDDQSTSPPRTLHFPDLAMTPDARVAITGPNGAGKSTLLRHILQNLLIPPDRVTYLPQEMSGDQSAQILHDARQLSDAKLGSLMNVVSRMGSDPQRLLQTPHPSPGEVRKLLLALGITRAAHLIIMDEPTNHLDLPSIQCLEQALAQSPCGLFLVSHDLPFLTHLTPTWWHIHPSPTSLQNQLTIPRHPPTPTKR